MLCLLLRSLWSVLGVLTYRKGLQSVLVVDEGCFLSFFKTLRGTPRSIGQAAGWLDTLEKYILTNLFINIFQM